MLAPDRPHTRVAVVGVAVATAEVDDPDVLAASGTVFVFLSDTAVAHCTLRVVVSVALVLAEPNSVL